MRDSQAMNWFALYADIFATTINMCAHRSILLAVNLTM